jgi:energy-coupling factor transporter ATP-binding protein EcfA2
VSSFAADADDAVAASGLGYTPPGARASTLEDVHLVLRRGSCVWLGGASGAGKTTLLRAMAGVPPRGGRLEGRVRTVGGRPGLLLQNVETQLLCTTVAEEVGLGLEFRGVAREARSDRVAAALEAVGLAGFERRLVDGLSMGEKQRVLLAALLAPAPQALLLDEPTSQLDPEGRRRLAGLLGELKRRGHALLVADHRHAPYAGLADRLVALKQGRLEEVTEPPGPESGHAPPAAPGAAMALELDGLSVRDAEGRERLAAVSLRVRRGERVHLAGANGAGKTTLLRAVAGLVRPSSGSLRVCGTARPRPGRVGLLFQNPERNFFEASVGEEVAFALRRLDAWRGRVEARVREVLDLCGIAHLVRRSPLRLSYGEQHRVALASVLAPAPDVLLLDEPFAGLDLAGGRHLLDVLGREQARRPLALVLASHDALPVPGWAHRGVTLVRGEGP